MSDARRTRLNTELTNRGLSLTAAQSHHDLEDILRVVKATGGTVSKAVDSVATCDEVVLATIGSQTHTITVRAVTPGPGAIVSVAIADAGNDTLAVTNTAGAIAIALANTTGSKNTLTLIKAAIEAANSSTTGAAHSVGCFITNTASTQMASGGTNTVTATAPGGTAAGGIKSSTLGAVATGALTVLPA